MPRNDANTLRFIDTPNYALQVHQLVACPNEMKRSALSSVGDQQFLFD